MSEIYKTILPLPPSVNAAYGQRGATQRFKSKKYIDWLEICPELPPLGIECVVRIEYLIYFPDKRERDCSNFTKIPLDFLVNQGVLKDDNWKIVQQEEIRFGGIDKENARLEIIIKAID